MDPAFTEAFLNREHIRKDGSRFSHHRVLGRRLWPFSLWHSFLLEAMDSPLLHFSPLAASLQDLEEAVAVCSRGFAPLKLPGNGVVSQVRRQWYARRLNRARVAFAAYLADYCAEPDFMETGHSKPVKTPWQLFRVGQLMRYGRMTERQAWEYPRGAGVWLATALAEAGGAPVNIMSEAMRDALREAGNDV